MLFKNPRDKLEILTLAKQMYPRQTDWFLNQYEEAVKRPFGVAKGGFQGLQNPLWAMKLALFQAKKKKNSEKVQYHCYNEGQ